MYKEIFNTSGNPLVVVGKQNWLFYKSYGVTPAQLNLEPFTEDELHDWAQNIVERNSFLKQYHIKFLLVLTPEKGSMYPELLPPGWHRSNRITRLEQLQNYLKEHTNIDFVDARHLLAEEKAAGQKIYHSNDSHWNQRSAFVGAGKLNTTSSSKLTSFPRDLRRCRFVATLSHHSKTKERLGSWSLPKIG